MPTTTIVLRDSIPWTRYICAEQGMRTQVHVANPDLNDLVIVTEGLAILAIEKGLLSLQKAVELGVMRLYGTPAQKAVFLAKVGNLGEQPFPKGDDGLLKPQVSLVAHADVHIALHDKP
jgi:hypothetical protein